MTKSLGYQKEVFNIHEVLEYFRTSNFEDCRINAYPSFTKYYGINRIASSFLMIDIDLKDFASKAKLDQAMNRVLKKIGTTMRDHPTVIWTGNGYHIYQPMQWLPATPVKRSQIGLEYSLSLIQGPLKSKLLTRFKITLLINQSG